YLFVFRACLRVAHKRCTASSISLRPHSGMVVPCPIQSAMIAALADDDHVRQQKARDRNRRTQLLSAIEPAGLAVDHSEAGLYLWIRDPNVTRPTAQDSWELVDRFAQAGILVGPGVFYSSTGNGYIRVSLTA